MSLVSDLVRGAMELLLLPFDALAPWLALTLISIPTAVVALLAVRYTTNQKKLERARDLMVSTLYEMRLFIDEPLRVFRAGIRLLGSSFSYTARTLPALVLLIPVLGLLFLHLELRYGYAEAEPGDQIMIGVELEPGADPGKLSLRDGPFELTAHPMFVADEHRVYYELELLEPEATLVFQDGAGQVTKRIRGRGPPSFERRRGLAGLWAFGVERALPSASEVVAVQILDRQTKEYSVIGMAWWVYWLLVSIVIAMFLKRPLGVVI